MKRKQNAKLTNKMAIEQFLERIDMTDDLLRVKVQNGNAEMVVQKDGRRRWKPPPTVTTVVADHFSMRKRLFELMKQAIYQARDKMRIMQKKRKVYKKNSLFKMGFLIGKTDSMCKTYAKFSTRAFRACQEGRRGDIDIHRIFHILSSQERILGHWMTIDLLIQVIESNDERARQLINDPTRNVSGGWDFLD
ncbi:hypothetical protein K1T71_005901 [Dendrolimus kikuchii]|uniref:Uncharacterized protein n=1 Tax=Dendrolimus kikuchii TaxID=765133 RepID=A0ACC1D3A7_9NEOP|nr:hypothetical protein K1T71_005901 [Dendrolimus kikuchii]